MMHMLTSDNSYYFNDKIDNLNPLEAHSSSLVHSHCVAIPHQASWRLLSSQD